MFAGGGGGGGGCGASVVAGGGGVVDVEAGAVVVAAGSVVDVEATVPARTCEASVGDEPQAAMTIPRRAVPSTQRTAATSLR